MLSVGVLTVAHELRRYGEAETADWVLTCSDDELVRLCSIAEWLLYNGPTKASGASMYIATACALAAVYVREGAPRSLARSRRGKVSDTRPLTGEGRRPDWTRQRAVPPEHGVGDGARRFWATAG